MQIIWTLFFLNFSFGRFKNNGGNFHVKLPLKDKLISNVSVPEDLVQIQAYLRWERKGKQMYTPEQEKVCELYSLVLLISNYHCFCMSCFFPFPFSFLLPVGRKTLEKENASCMLSITNVLSTLFLHLPL